MARSAIGRAATSWASGRWRTTAGACRPRGQAAIRMTSRRRSPPRSRWIPAAPSCRTTSRRTCRSTVRSTPIAAASMAASIASRGPTHAYLGLSPGLDFESKLFAKPDAATLLEKELRKPGYKPRRAGARRRHRRLSADRAAIPHHAPGAEGAERLQPSGRHHHQERAGAGRSRPHRRHGEARSHHGLDVGHQPRPRSGAQAGAARLDAAQPSGCDQDAERGRRAGGGLGRADHPGDHRSRDRSHHRGRPRKPAPSGSIGRCCACRWRSRTCSSNGWSPMRRARPSTP